MNKCAVTGEEFMITKSDQGFYEKMDVPAPSLCPEERQRQRISYRNFRSLYRRTCDATGKTVVSMYHPDQPFPVYENNYWWGDEWDSLDYGQEINWEESFFDQYHQLAQAVPRFATSNVKCQNAQYANFAWNSKDCYLVFGCVRNEDCLYGHIVWDCKNCVDNLYIFRCEWCHECIDCLDCYDLHFSTECSSCSESYFLHDCRGCKNCFACTNLRQKQYCFMNEQLTKEVYEAKIQKLKPFSRETLEMGRTWLEKEKKEKCVFPPLFGVQNEDVTGNHIYESKNCHHAYDAKKGEDSKFLYTSYGQKNSQDISFTGDETRFCYNCLTMALSENCRCCHSCFQGSDLDYCEYCFSCSNCFGCTGLRNKQYCILNKRYSKEDYTKLKEKLMEKMKKEGQWGEFFPMGHSPFAYNEAIVQEYCPLSEAEIVARNLRWKKKEEPATYDGPQRRVPPTITDVQSDIVDVILTCQESQQNYRILKNELAFFQKVGLPLSPMSPDIRHKRRMKLRNPRELWKRPCAECSAEIESTFVPDRPETVLCETCYQGRL